MIKNILFFAALGLSLTATAQNKIEILELTVKNSDCPVQARPMSGPKNGWRDYNKKIPEGTPVRATRAKNKPGFLNFTTKKAKNIFFMAEESCMFGSVEESSTRHSTLINVRKDVLYTTLQGYYSQEDVPLGKTINITSAGTTVALSYKATNYLGVLGAGYEMYLGNFSVGADGGLIIGTTSLTANTAAVSTTSQKNILVYGFAVSPLAYYYFGSLGLGVGFPFLFKRQFYYNATKNVIEKTLGYQYAGRASLRYDMKPFFISAHGGLVNFKKLYFGGQIDYEM